MNVFTWFSDRNNITFLIAIAGFAMSLYNFFALCGIGDAHFPLTM